MMHPAFSGDPRSIGAYLDDLLASRLLPLSWVTRIWRRGDLPFPLQRYVRQLAPHAEWRAYTDDLRLYFAIASMRVRTRHSCLEAPLKIRFLVCDASMRHVEEWESVCESDSPW